MLLTAISQEELNSFIIIGVYLSFNYNIWRLKYTVCSNI